MKNIAVIFLCLLIACCAKSPKQSNVNEETVLPDSIEQINKPDTINIDAARISTIIEAKTSKKEGMDTVSYYMVYERDTIPTTKAVVEELDLRHRNRERISLAIVCNEGRKHIILKGMSSQIQSRKR